MTHKDNTERKGERIAKVIARSGYCSRRAAERLILEGAVKVNGVIIESPALNVTDESIKVNNKLLQTREPSRVWLLHKPKGYITSHGDPQNRTTIFDILPREMPRVISVGRLDMSTEGLLILTNDGELSRYMSHPSTGWTRKYRVRVHGRIREGMFDNLERRGINIEGVRYAPMKVKAEGGAGGTNNWLEVSVTEGKNREVRKVLEHYGLQVNRLIRTVFGPFQLGKLKTGQIKEIPMKTLKELLGKNIKEK